MALVRYRSILDETERAADILFFLHRIKEVKELEKSNPELGLKFDVFVTFLKYIVRFGIL